MQLSKRLQLIPAVMVLALGVQAVSAPAGESAKGKPQGPVPPGGAVGDLTIEGKTVHLSSAATFRNDKHLVLLLTDAAVPAAGWKDAGDEVMYLMSGHKFTGVEFYLDEQRHVTATNYLAAAPPTGANTLFELKLDPAAGKALTGSAHSTPFGEKQSNAHVKLDVRFNAPLR